MMADKTKAVKRPKLWRRYRAAMFEAYLICAMVVFIVSTIFIVGVLLVAFGALRRWIAVLNGAPAPAEAFGPPMTPDGEVRMGCC